MKTCVLIAFISCQLISYGQVTVVLRQPPPYQFKLENMWNIILINPTGTAYRVYLQGTATETTTGLVADCKTAVFTLQPGTRVVSPRDIMPISIHSANARYDNVVKNIGGMPAGDYEICVAIINANDGSELGNQCIQQEVMNFSQVELLGPENLSFIESGKTIARLQSNEEAQNEQIQIVNGSFIIFNWLPLTGANPSQPISYSIRIVEMFASQSSYDAMQSNPAFYKQNNIYSAIFQFPSAAREFMPGKRYAWQVSAYINGALVSTSEVREFTYGKYEAAQVEKKPQKQSGIPIGLSGLKGPETSQYFSRFNPGPSSGSGFNFSGSAKIESQTDRREGYNSEVPLRFTNLELNPVLTIYGLPFSSNILLSTQQSSSRQKINSFSLNFDIQTFRNNLMKRVSDKADELAKSEATDLLTLKENSGNMAALKTKLAELEGNAVNQKEIDSLKTKLAFLEDIEKTSATIDGKKSEIENLKNPENLKENLEKFDLISGTEKIFMSIETIGFGKTYPSYTPYTLDGVPVNGVNIAINPAFFYIAFAGTKNQEGIPNTAFRRDLYAGRFGIGTKEDSHLHFTGLYVKDEEPSISVDSLNTSLTPKANYIFGMEGKLALMENHFTLEGEANGSMLTRDVRAADLENNAIPQFLINMVHPKISSSADFMYALKTSYALDATNTKISFGMKMVGPGYTSLGVPNLQTDFFGFDGKLEQKFIEKRISLSASFKTQRDNLIDWKSYTTTTSSLNVNLGLRFPDLPILSFIYSPYFQKNNTSDLSQKLDNRTSMFSVMSSYSHQIMDFQSSTSFSFSLMQTKTVAGIADFSTDNYMLTQTASFNLPVTFIGTFGIIHLKPAGDYTRITTFDLSATFPVFEIVQGTLGGRTAVEKDKNEKFGVYVGASASLLENVTLDIRAEQSTYSEWNFATDYSDFVLRTTIQATW
jgi:hypothetical protein